MEYVLTAVVLLSALVQGGFFPSMYLAAGIFLAVVCAFQKQRKPVLAEILLWAFAIWYPIASLLNGYDSASMAQGLQREYVSCAVISIFPQNSASG